VEAAVYLQQKREASQQPEPASSTTSADWAAQLFSVFVNFCQDHIVVKLYYVLKATQLFSVRENTANLN
jgi:hypothetical protein